LKLGHIWQMFRERRNREALYRLAGYWDMKALKQAGDAASMWPNNYLNVYYHREQLVVLQRYLPDVTGVSVLDIGCGTGRISRYLAERGATVLGIDFSSQAIAMARAQSGPDNPSYRVQSIFDLTDESTFDVLVSVATLTVACRDGVELLEALRRLRRALRSPGRAVFLEPLHRGFLHRVLNMEVQEFCTVMAEAGFQVQEVSHLHWWPARLALAYIQWPRPITAAGYHLGEAIMHLTGRRHMGDYQAVLAIAGETL